MARTFDEELADYYSSQELSPEVFERLLRLAELGRGSGDRFGARADRRALAIVAALLLLLGGVILAVRGAKTPSPGSDLPQLVAHEIAVNHLKDGPVEFPGDDYAAVSKQMAALGFRLSAPQRLLGSGYRVFGARYCSIQGRRACQLKLHGARRKTLTLYETPLTDHLRVTAGTYLVDGVRVTLWRENALFFGLAETEPDPSPR